MMNYRNLLIGLFLCSLYVAKAQVTSIPSPLQEDSENVVIYFHADQGDKGLMDVRPPEKIYAHTGVTTQNGSWQYAPSWGNNLAKYELQYEGPNLWSLYIGNLREYYGVNSNETITQLAFVFRNENNSKTGRAIGGKDIFLDVSDAGFQISLSPSVTGNILTSSNSTVTFNVGTSYTANITLAVNNITIASATETKNLTETYTFTDSGNYTVVASASNNDTTIFTKLDYTYIGESKEVPYPGINPGLTPPMGPIANADGTVTFCIAAPEKNDMMIVGAWNDYLIDNSQLMNYTIDSIGLKYFWWKSPVLDPTEMYGYYFIVDGITEISDPYARLVLDPQNDKYLVTDVFPNLPDYPYDKITNVPLAIYQGNMNDYDWIVDDFKGVESSNLIIYELLFRDFTGTEGQHLGNGTVRQAIEKIPYLKTLGINAIEVLPIMEFTGNNSWGYNPNFYFAPDKAYGTPDDYKEFIDICHQNGIAVILDMVFNQSDGLHPWYQMYMPGQNPFYNMDSPHAYSVLNDWNQGYPLVQRQWKDVIEFWLTEYKFDGFRFDLVKGLGDNDSYANNGTSATDAYNQSRIDRMIELQKIMTGINPNAYFINEDLATSREENAMAYYGQMNWANINHAGIQFAIGEQSSSNMNRFYAPDDDNRLWGSTVSYLESHDEQRLAYEQEKNGVTGIRGNVTASMRRLGSAAAQMILSPGAHMIWQFSEMGNSQNTKTSIGNDVDPKTVNWSLLDEPNHYGLFENYCELIKLRNENPELFSKESASFSISCNENNWQNGRYLYSRTHDGMKELITVINPNVTGTLTVQNLPFDSNHNEDYYIVTKSYNTEASFDASLKTVTVRANSFVTIASNKVSKIDTPEEKSDNTLLVSVSNRQLTIDKTDSPVTIFTINGVNIGTLSEGDSITLTSGFYLLKNNKEILKISIK